MTKIIILRGLPGSGKSTWAKKYIENNLNVIRISRDDLRNMKGKYNHNHEKLITGWEIQCINTSLEKGHEVLIDATNLKPKYIKKFFQKYYPKYTIILKDFFHVPLEECIQRDKEREQSVGEEVIVEMARKYLSKSLDVSSKSFIDSLYSQPLKEEKIIQDPNLPHTIIVDLDGTLAIHNGRGPFEYHRCDEDLLNTPVGDIARPYVYGKGTNVIYLSGREDSCKEKTIKWLEKHSLFLPTTLIYMRKTGDYRKDSIIKKEIFNEHIRDKYYIKFVLDDRLQVCRMWHSLGLPLLKVGDPDADF